MASIYNHYVTHTVVTFEEEPVPPEQMAARIDEVQSSSLPWLVIERAGRVRGYAYAGKWKTRAAYRFSVETSVYLDPESVQRGMGSELYTALLSEVAARGAHAVMGGIALPNPGSVALHERFGFHKVAHFAEVGFKFGQWVDVGYWQKIL